MSDQPLPLELSLTRASARERVSSSVAICSGARVCAMEVTTRKFGSAV